MSISPNQAKAVVGALGGGSVVAAAIALALPMIEKWEGTRLVPYRDIVGIWTVCTGQTNVPMRTYTREECGKMLGDAVRSEYGAGVLKAVPALEKRPYQLAASISLAYNVGVVAYSRSTVARRFNAGDWKGGCEAFLMWNKAGGRVVQGLVNRRRDEMALCLRGLDPVPTQPATD